MRKRINSRPHLVLLVFLGTLVYSIFRYNVFKEVSWIDLPIYVLNKAISLSAVILLLLFTIDHFKDKRRFWVDQGVILSFIIVHIILSLLILGPEYYGKFYTGFKLNWVGNITLLAGVGAFMGILIVNITAILKKIDILQQGIVHEQALIRGNLLLLGTHLFVMGFNGWLTPAHWPGYLPPISLIAFLTVVVVAMVKR